MLVKCCFSYNFLNIGHMQANNKFILAQTRLFMGLDEDILEKIAEHTEIKNFKRGEHLFYQDDPAHSFYTVIDGWVSVYRGSLDGDQIILNVFKNGESFAEPAALSLQFYPANALAESNCTVLEVNMDSFKSVLLNNPDMVLNIINRLSQRLFGMVNEMEKLRTQSAPFRLAEFILELCPDNIDKTVLTLPFSKHCLAARLKLKPETLSRAFISLKQCDVATDRGTKITIGDINKLQEFIGS